LLYGAGDARGHHGMFCLVEEIDIFGCQEKVYIEWTKSMSTFETISALDYSIGLHEKVKIGLDLGLLQNERGDRFERETEQLPCWSLSKGFGLASMP
jgi:hypothetical protein